MGVVQLAGLNLRTTFSILFLKRTRRRATRYIKKKRSPRQTPYNPSQNGYVRPQHDKPSTLQLIKREGHLQKESDKKLGEWLLDERKEMLRSYQDPHPRLVFDSFIYVQLRYRFRFCVSSEDLISFISLPSKIKLYNNLLYGS
jgi:hypothetical protein